MTRRSRAGLALTSVLCALSPSPSEPFLAPAAVSRREASTTLFAVSTCGTAAAAAAAAEVTGSLGSGQDHSLTGTRDGSAQAREWGARRRRRTASSRLYQTKARGPPEGDEGIADLESLSNPGKDRDYGSERALQYGVSGVAAGASDHFFSADTRVVFGVNALEIGLVELYDTGLQRALIVTGWNQARADPVVWELLPRGFDLAWHSVSAEPSLTDVAEGAALALEHRADCVVAMGGAAVIDAAKAIAAIAYADKDHNK
ncbi:unnamed protein product, partial [Laminaria digitata]